MLASPFLYKDAQLADSENFDLLRQKGREQIEQLASRLWTDYNSHDPGITLLETLCYAITDLGYRTQFEIKDLLTRSEKGANYTVARFHTAAEVMSCYPGTFSDLRKVLIDIRGVRNVWIYAVDDAVFCTEAEPEEPVEGEPEGEGGGGRFQVRRAAERPCLVPCEAEGEKDTRIIRGLYEICIEYEEYVQELRVGVPDITCLNPGQGNYLPPKGQGICFEIEQDVVLTAISVYTADPDPQTILNPDGTATEVPGDPVPLFIHLRDAAGTLIQTWEKELSEPHTQIRLELNHTFTYDAEACDPDEGANRYYLTAEGGEGCLWLFAHKETGFPFELPNYVQLTAGTPQADMYYFFYDWEWDTTESEDTLGKWQRGRLGEADDTAFPSEYVQPDQQALVFDVEHPLSLDAVHVFANRPGNLTIRLLNDRGEEIHSLTTYIADALCKKRVSICWDIPACQNYRLVAETDQGMELTLSRGGAFPYEIESVMILLGGMDRGRLEQIYPFFYDLEISWRMPETGQLDDYSLTKGRIRREVWRKLHAHRNLGEDPVRITEVSTELIGIDADISLGAGADVNEVHAQVLCLLEEHIKPSIRFYSLSEMMSRGYSTEEIFRGPLLEHGFIDPKEFQQALNRSELRTSDVINLLMDIPGVEAVKKVRLHAYRDGVRQRSEKWLLCLENQNCWKPNFAPEHSCLEFRQGRIICRSDKREVNALLEEKRLQTRPTKTRVSAYDLPIPVGEDRQVRDFWPAQHDLPAIYRAGKYEVPEHEGSVREAQARQLKAFMMFFEQILANYLAQLDQVPTLLSWESQNPIQTYFTQLATEGIVHAEELYQDYAGLPAQLEALIETEAEACERRNRFLDHLLARFAEDFTDYSLLMFSLFDQKQAGIQKVIRDKERFLASYPALSKARAQGFDYYSSELSMAGYQRRVMALLGMYPTQPGVLEPVSGYHLQHHAEQGWRFAIANEEGQTLFLSRYVSSEGLAAGLFELMLLQGAEASNYVEFSRVVDDCETSGWTLVGPCADTDPPQEPLGEVPDGSEAARDALIAWIATYSFPEVTEDPLPETWLDLASDYFFIENDDSGWHFVIREGEDILFRSRSCERKAAAEQILDAAIRLGHLRESYRIDSEACRWELLNACEAGEEPEVLGFTEGLEQLHLVLSLFEQAWRAEGLHIVEHVLLRPRSMEAPLMQVLPGYTHESHPPIADPYSFQATLLLPAWPKRSQSLAWRQLVEDTLRREAPAHVYVHIIWVTYSEMRRFELAYLDWLTELRKLVPHYQGLAPLPAAMELEESWHNATRALFDSLNCLKSTFPPARLYDPATSEKGESPMLGRMSLRAM